MKSFYIGITGHRPNKLGGYREDNPTKECVKNWIRKNLLKYRKEHKSIIGLSGMALGTDQWFCEVCYALKIPYIAAIPFVDMEIRWPEYSQQHYRTLLHQAIDKVVVSDGDYASWKLQVRNEYVVDHSDILLAVHDGSPGGTYNCIKYAVKKGKSIISIKFPLKISQSKMLTHPDDCSYDYDDTFFNEDASNYEDNIWNSQDMGYVP